MSEELAQELERLRRIVSGALWLMDAGPNNPNAWNTVLANLPAGGTECERRAEAVVDILRLAGVKPRSLN